MNPRFLLTFVVCTLLIAGTIARADEPLLQPMSEDTLRSLFVFGPQDGLKYAVCDDKHTFTCTYVWGILGKDDALRVEMGGRPDGKKLQVITAQAASASDFDRVLAAYKDAVPISDLGVTAVWSEMRGQLSILTASNRVVHVSTDMTESDDKQAAAIAIANLVLAAL